MPPCSKKNFCDAYGIKSRGYGYRYYSRIELLQQSRGNENNPKILQHTVMKKERNNGRKASSEALMIPSADANLDSRGRREVGRRSFLKGLGLAGATLLPASALLATKVRRESGRPKRKPYQRRCGNSPVPGRGRNPRKRSLGAILGARRRPSGKQFAATNPATGVAPTPTGGNTPYTNGLLILDGDMPQYIHDNTDDEFSHANLPDCLLGF